MFLFFQILTEKRARLVNDAVLKLQIKTIKVSRAYNYYPPLFHAFYFTLDQALGRVPQLPNHTRQKSFDFLNAIFG